MPILSFGAATPSEEHANLFSDFFQGCQGNQKAEVRPPSFCWNRLSEQMRVLEDYCVTGTAECSESEFTALSKIFREANLISCPHGSLEIEMRELRPRHGGQLSAEHHARVKVSGIDDGLFPWKSCIKVEHFDHVRCQGKFHLDVYAENIARLKNLKLEITVTSYGKRRSQVFGTKMLHDIFASNPDSFHDIDMKILDDNGELKSGGLELTLSYCFRSDICSSLIKFGVLISLKSKMVIYVFPDSRAEKLGIQEKKFSLFHAELTQEGLVSFQFIPIDILDKFEFGLEEVCANHLLEQSLDDASFAKRFYPNIDNFDKLEGMLDLFTHLADFFGDYVANDILDFSYGRFQGTWDIDGERVRLMSFGKCSLIGLSSDRSTYFAGTHNNDAMFLYQYEVRAGDFYSPNSRHRIVMMRRPKLANVVRAIFGVRNGNTIDAMSLDRRMKDYGKTVPIFLMHEFKQLRSSSTIDHDDFQRKCHRFGAAPLLTAETMDHDHWHRYIPHRMKANRDDPKDLEFFRIVKKYRCKKFRRDPCHWRGARTVRDDPECENQGRDSVVCYWPQTAIQYAGAIMKSQTLETREEMIDKIRHREDFPLSPEITQREKLRVKRSGSRKERRNRINGKRTKIKRVRKKRNKKRTQIRTAQRSFKMKPMERKLYLSDESDWSLRSWIYHVMW